MTDYRHYVAKAPRCGGRACGIVVAAAMLILSHVTAEAAQSLAVGETDRCFGGICQTSLLYKIVFLEAMVLCGIFAGFSVTKTFPIWGRPDGRWIAGVATGEVCFFYFLVALITGKPWPFGI